MFKYVMMATVFMSFSVQASEVSEMVKSVEEVNSLRETLVKAVPHEVTPEVFQATCKPVGKRAKKIAMEKEWVFRQASHKSRNPKNTASKIEKKAIEMFKKDFALRSLWMVIDGEDHYFRKIVVQKNCLVCHGAKSTRPGFVKKKYLKDKAYGFKEGDIRGVYHVYKK